MIAERELFEIGDLSIEERKTALIELCAAGLLTCTHGEPGSDGAKYALAWERLNNPEQFSAEVRERHTENMRRLGFTKSESRPDRAMPRGRQPG